MDTGAMWVESTSAPAATSRPTMVSMRGSPAATRLPKAMTKMIMVTGHESISERSMALRLAELKLAHSALSPVRVTEMPGRESRPRGPARASAARTMALASAAAPAVTTPVLPSRDNDTPGLGCDDGGDTGFAVQELRDLGQDRLGGGVGGDRPVVVDDHHLERGGAQTGEVALDDGSGLDRLAGRVLPARHRPRRARPAGRRRRRRPGRRATGGARPGGGWRTTHRAGPSARCARSWSAGASYSLVGLDSDAELVRCHGRGSLGLGRAGDEDQVNREYTPLGIRLKSRSTAGSTDERGRSRTRSPWAAPGIKATRRSGPACT